MKSARIGVRAAIATLVAVVAISALLLNTQISSGYTFATGDGFNLKIDSHALYNGILVPASTWALKNLVPGVDKFFNLNDVKPGDHGEATISLHVNKNAWVCLDFKNLQSHDNGVNEPESHEDANGATSGELADGLEFFAWRDDGDDVFELGEKPIFGTTTQSASIILKDKTYAIADYKTGNPLTASSTRYIGISWCAGDLSVNVATASVSCDGTALGNEAQTDSMSVDISIRAVPKNDKPKFLCGDGTVRRQGEEIGLFIKCQLLATQGWPLPSFSVECPDGFQTSTSTSSSGRDRDDRDTSTGR